MAKEYSTIRTKPRLLLIATVLMTASLCLATPTEAWSKAKLPRARRMVNESPRPIGRPSESLADDTTYREQTHLLSVTIQSANDNSEKRGGNAFLRLARSYNDQLQKKPLLTKSISACVIDGVGDLLAQWLEYCQSSAMTGFSFQWDRFVSFLLVGLLFEGPFTHYWFDFLDKIGDRMDRHHQQRLRLKRANGATMLEQKQKAHPQKAMVQLVVDQTLGVVLLYPAYLLVYSLVQSVVQRRAWTSPPWASLPQLLKRQYQVWPLADYVLLKWVAPSYRSGMTSLFNVAWNALSFCTLVATAAH